MPKLQLPNGRQQFIDPSTGRPLAMGTVEMYIPDTSTPKTTWQDIDGNAENSNPINLNAAGQCVIWGIGAYRQVVKDSIGNTVWDEVVYTPDLSIYATQEQLAALELALAGGGIRYATASGTANAITATFTPPLSSVGGTVIVRAIHANTDDVVTFTPDGLTTYDIKKFGGLALTPETETGSGDIYGDGHEMLLRFSPSDSCWELLNPFVPPPASNATTTTAGLAKKATQAQVDTGTDDNAYMTALTYKTNFDARAANFLSQSGSSIADQTYSGPGYYTFAHGLGHKPKIVVVTGIVKAGQTDGGYIAGDTLILTPCVDTAGSAEGWGIQIDDTNVVLHVLTSFFAGINSNDTDILRLSSASKWDLHVDAWG